MNTTSAEIVTLSHNYSIFGSHDLVLGAAAGAINIILGLPLNLYVKVLILSRGAFASDFFSLNLAVSEILFSIFIMCYILFVMTGSFACFQAFMFSTGLMYTARPFFQCFICVDCYVRVVHPVLFLRFKRLRYKMACSSVAWLITLGCCIYSKYTYFKPLYFYAYFILNLLFFSIICFCCLASLRALNLSRPGEITTERKKSNGIKTRAFKAILIILIAMAVNFFLYLAAIPSQCCIESMIYSRVLSVCMSLALATGFIQPLLYLHRNGKLTCSLHLKE